MTQLRCVAGNAHKRMEPGSGGDLAIVGSAFGVNEHVWIHVGVSGILTGAAPQKVQSHIVGDAKQPALRVRDRSHVRRCLDRFDQRLLHHVLAIDDRAGHARAIAMSLLSGP
jgi:hypothetical protein